jgi:radical SAM superfamily enzyme YgiQ (UPF0313 family)
MKRNFLLINPWIYDFSAYNLWYSPLGLLSLASLLRGNGGNVSWIDCLDSDIPEMKFEPNIKLPKTKDSGEGSYASEIIPNPPQLTGIKRHYRRYGITQRIFLKMLDAVPTPDVVMISSMMTYWYPGIFDTIRLVKIRFPQVPVVLGGNYVTLCPEHAMLSGADFCLSGPGESTLPELLKNLFNIDLNNLPDSNNLNSYPYPAFDLSRKRDCLPILTSRGCPYRCSYCASHVLNDFYRRRDPLHVVNEIEYWYKRFGIRNFSFYDDALFINAQEVAIPLLKEIAQRKMPIEFHCPNGLHLR